MLPSVGTPEEKVKAIYTKELHADNICAYHIGDIIWRAGGEAPVGFLLCNGAEVGRATYPKLFEVIGTKWGAGDGVSTFNLPNLIGRFPEGALEAGGYKEAGLPNITGGGKDIEGLTGGPSSGTYNEGALTLVKNPGGFVANSSNYLGVLFFDASKSNSIYGASDTVQPSSALLIPYVKAFKGASADSTDLAISEVANDVLRISADMVKKSEADYVVDSYHDAEGNWYRKYSDGWVEQGGINIPTGDDYNIAVSFLKAFKDTNYTLLVSAPIVDEAVSPSNAITATSTVMVMVGGGTNRQTNTGFYLNALHNQNLSAGIGRTKWYACGMGADV